MQANYPLAQSVFAGPTLLVVSLLLVTTVLQLIAPGPMTPTDGPFWIDAIKISLSVFGTFLFCFPIALGFSALGAYLKKKDDT